MDMIKVDIRGESKQILRIFKNADIVTIEDLLNKIIDLDDEVSELEDRIRDIEQDIVENYKPISKEEQYDMHECNFH